MLHRYFPHTQQDIDRMLTRCGATKVEDLYADVPAELLLGRDLDLPEEMSEKEVRDFFTALRDKNTTLTCFAGGGVYDHYSPSVINAIISRSEFLTAYTPYQPEISQGTLQYIFEYQSMMTQLTGLDVSNASMYDGATATAEAMMVCVASARKRNRVLVSATVNQQVRNVMATYAHYHGITLEVVPEKDGVTDLEALKALLAGSKDIAGVVVAAPNCYGIVEDYTGLAEAVHEAKALLVMNCVASTLAVLKTPAQWGADIACGDGQSLGIPMSYGGPYIGFMCCTKALMRKIPGRIVGATKDKDGRRVFVLTLQAREQHIRREKATSNICSNQGLMSLYVTIYMSLMGPEGLKEVNEISCGNAHVLAEQLEAIGKMKLVYPGKPYLNEFLMELNNGLTADKVIEAALAEGIFAGLKIADNKLLIAATEMQSKADIEKYVKLVNTL